MCDKIDLKNLRLEICSSTKMIGALQILLHTLYVIIGTAEKNQN